MKRIYIRYDSPDSFFAYGHYVDELIKYNYLKTIDKLMKAS